MTTITLDGASYALRSLTPADRGPLQAWLTAKGAGLLESAKADDAMATPAGLAAQCALAGGGPADDWLARLEAASSAEIGVLMVTLATLAEPMLKLPKPDGMGEITWRLYQAALDTAANREWRRRYQEHKRQRAAAEAN